MTEELFVFFSGHGFAFVNAGTRADILISADFQRSDVSGPSCLKIDEMISWLREHLGPGCHFYFVDACRNTLDSTQVAIGPLLPFERQALPEASTFLLQSTLPGATAQVRGAFPKILLAGLRGESSAWQDAAS